MKNIIIKRISDNKKLVSVIENGITKGFRTMAINDDRKTLAAINLFKLKFGILDKDIIYLL